ncbi:hypothetical protein Pan44_12870 [Caulifigura coniformis]|uniref:Uncharacterized protein n=2 Tax=Caulifigura coniformis TaxID=2527983 RepID=A0A517SAW1_9PLAN|nr:hypothetical protein Pan44_12870 [Caulifigura coniformis]
MLVLGAAAAWILLLAGLAFWTANPVTLNLASISLARESGAVIIGEVVEVRKPDSEEKPPETSAPDYSVRVVEVLGAKPGFADDFGIAIGKSAGVVDTSHYQPKVGEKLVLPLLLHSSVHLMQTTGRPYAATPRTIADVKNVLEDAAPSGR